PFGDLVAHADEDLDDLLLDLGQQVRTTGPEASGRQGHVDALRLEPGLQGDTLERLAPGLERGFERGPERVDRLAAALALVGVERAHLALEARELGALAGVGHPDRLERVEVLGRRHRGERFRLQRLDLGHAISVPAPAEARSLTGAATDPRRATPLRRSR